jgi:hypothetical protein
MLASQDGTSLATPFVAKLRDEQELPRHLRSERLTRQGDLEQRISSAVERLLA